MTSFLIGYPDIPARGTLSFYSAHSAATGFNEKNLITGPRGAGFKLSAAVNATAQIQTDLGASVTASAQYLYIARANCLKASGATAVKLYGGASSPANNLIDTITLASETLVGPRSEDAFSTFAASTAYRYWLEDLTTSVSVDYFHSKCYFGTLFDMGREPTYPARVTRQAVKRCGRDAPLQVTLQWDGIGEAKRVSFVSTIAAYADTNPVVLYDGSGKVLQGWTALHCRLIDWSFTPTSVREVTVTASFEEEI